VTPGRLKREPGAIPGLSRSGKRERTPQTTGLTAGKGGK
jgi:hypothetical protein